MSLILNSGIFRRPPDEVVWERKAHVCMKTEEVHPTAVHTDMEEIMKVQRDTLAVSNPDLL